MADFLDFGPNSKVGPKHIVARREKNRYQMIVQEVGFKCPTKGFVDIVNRL